MLIRQRNMFNKDRRRVYEKAFRLKKLYTINKKYNYCGIKESIGKPNEWTNKKYEELYKRYLMIYEKYKNIMKKLTPSITKLRIKLKIRFENDSNGYVRKIYDSNNNILWEIK